MITSRVLPPDEWIKLANTPPYDQAGLPDPTHWAIIVVERDDQIVATCAIFDAVHWDGFNIVPDEQKNPTVFRHLLNRSVETLQDNGIPGVHVTVPDDQPDLQAMVEAFGFVPAPGRLYIYAVPQKVH